MSFLLISVVKNLLLYYIKVRREHREGLRAVKPYKVAEPPFLEAESEVTEIALFLVVDLEGPFGLPDTDFLMLPTPVLCDALSSIRCSSLICRAMQA